MPLCVTQIFNNSVDAYASWTLFLIFVSILILISGVVLLTHKKPDVPAHHPSANPSSTSQRDGIALSSVPRPNGKGRRKTKGDEEEGGDEEEREGLRASGELEGVEGRDGEVMWDVGEASDEDDIESGDDPAGERTPRPARSESPSTARPISNLGTGGNETEEGMHLMRTSHDEDRNGDEEGGVVASTSTGTLGPQQTRRRSASSVSLIDADEEEMRAEFGEFKSSEATESGKASLR